MRNIDISTIDNNLRADIGSELGYTAYEAGMPGGTVSNQTLHIVHNADAGRGGIVQIGSGCSGVTFWTDAARAEDVFQRYLADEMTP